MLCSMRKALALLALTAFALPVPRKNESITRGQIRVKARKHADFRVKVFESMRDAVLYGNFSVSGGSGNDIIAAVVHEEEYPNWVNGHEARVRWDSGGKKTAGKFNVALPPGVYYLYFGNRFSAVSDKHVYVEATLGWTPPEE